MECPKCGFVLDADFVDCPRCGVIVAKFLHAHQEMGGSAVAVAAPAREIQSTVPSELVVRATALPLALVVARLAVNASPGLVRLFTMWVHESGHAVTAWLCGYSAVPGPWFTPIAAQRSPLFSVVLVAVLSYGGYRAWQLHRWFWVVASGGTLLVLLFCTVVLRPIQATQLFTFGGDAGCMVLGTLLMLTVYAREDHPVRQNQLRWAFLILGALALMDVYTVWSGPIDRLPFGENENGLSDPSVLTEMYGWNVLMLIKRYGEVAHACFAVLGVAYVTGLYREVTSRSRGREMPA